MRAMGLREQERRSRKIEWTKEQHSRDDWPRAWKWIGPIFGDCDQRTVRPEQLIGDVNCPDLIGLRPLVEAKVSESEAHRVIKVWRALWAKMAAFQDFNVDKDKDPSFAFANSAPRPRQDVWQAGEAVRLIKRAWRDGYRGLAALLAVAWDSQLSPVDARSLSPAQMRQDPVGIWFDLDLAKSGRGAKATLGRRAKRMLFAYLDQQTAKPLATAPIFRNRSGRSYSKDTLGHDFADVRALVFGPDEKRQLADFRRSGSVEAFAGDAPPEKVSAKMANSLSTSNRLHRTYAPVQLAAVRDVDQARAQGRRKIRDQGAAGEQTGTKIPTAPGRDSNTGVQLNPSH